MKRTGILAILVLFTLSFAASVFAQKNKKKDDKVTETPAAQTAVQGFDQQTVDTAISEMLAGWQLGDMELLHKHYADNVIVVSGAWEPALVGWDRFSAAYKVQRARMEGAMLSRTNTFITGNASAAWVTYQWELRAAVDGQPAAWRGHTSLVLEKRNGVWLIVLNHTSVVAEAQPRAQAPASPANSPGSAGH